MTRILRLVGCYFIIGGMCCALISCNQGDDNSAASSDAKTSSHSSDKHKASSSAGKKQGGRGSTNVNVALSSVCPSTVTLTATGTATLYADKQTELVTKESGYIESINIKEGQLVKAGDILIQLVNKEEKAKLDSAKIKVVSTKRSYDRGLAIIKVEGISQQSLDDLHESYLEAKSAKDQAQIALDNMAIVAPFDGYVGQINLSVGNYITSSSDLTSIVSANKLRAVYSLPSHYLDDVAIGQEVTISHYSSKNTLTGKVTFVAKSVNSSTQTISLTAEIDNKDKLFSPGQDVSVSQVIGTQDNTLLVPRLILTTDIGTYSVYTVKDNKAVQNTVTIGDQYGDNVVILSGIKSGDQVVTSGMDQLRQGADVTVTSIGKECSS